MMWKLVIIVTVVTVANCDILYNVIRDDFSKYWCQSCYEKNNSTCTIDLDDCDCQNSTSFDAFIENNNIKPHLEPPKLKCRQHDLISLLWEQEKENMYFLEIHTNFNENLITFSNLTICGKFTLNNLKSNSEYNIRLWAVDVKKSLIKSSLFTSITTTNPNKILPVRSVAIKNLTPKNNSYEALITWQPSEDSTCFYHIAWYGQVDAGTYGEVELKNLSDVKYETRLSNLIFDDSYTVSIHATDGVHLESEARSVDIKVPSCLDTLGDLEKCLPEQPSNLLVDITRHNHESFRYDIKLKWAKPKYQPDYYEIKFTNFENQTNLKITGDKTELILKDQPIKFRYHLVLTAWSKAGSSLSAVSQGNVLEHHKTIIYPNWSKAELVLTIILPTFVIFIFLFSVCLYKFMLRRKRKEERVKYFMELENIPTETQTMEMKNKIADDECINSDKWEINTANLTIQNILGEGAFGIVRKGIYYDKDRKIEVAIKMLKDLPTSDELRQFYQEIDMMKSVHSHPHLVSMIGCVTKTANPMLVVEFCPKGDLLSYLRSAWEKIMNKKFCNNIQYYNLPPSPNSHQKEFANLMYEFEDIEIQPKDLMIIARQIVVAMEYLTSLKILHRDLAARNILVCDNDLVKISDFGLSRDVYQDNVYFKIGNGRLPIRWMALESLTHQKYTAQSEVWSFGVLLWEIVTLGATPYPGIDTRDIIGLLKNGYRMERPSNCSKELFSIMSNCWRANPKERPTFSNLRQQFDAFLEDVCHYLNLEDFTKEFNNIRLETDQFEDYSMERYVNAFTRL